MANRLMKSVRSFGYGETENPGCDPAELSPCVGASYDRRVFYPVQEPAADRVSRGTPSGRDSGCARCGL